MAVSQMPLYGISLMGRRSEANGAPSFEIATHSGNVEPTARFTVSKDGNVGINTVYPEERLHIVGNAKIEGKTYFQDETIF